MQNTIADILTKLPEWERKNLNEAQTCQVIILRILAKLNYEIWEPFEICAQSNSGGGSGSYIPDYTVHLHRKDCFIIEAKALNKEFTDNDRTQAVNYVNAKNLRWAVLTNGKKWLFFDNKLDGEAAKRLALELDLRNPQIADYLTQLLAKELWLTDKPNERVSENIQLIKIKMQFDAAKNAYRLNEEGLSKMIAHELKLPEERKLAQAHFKPLAQWLLTLEGESSEKSVSAVTVNIAPNHGFSELSMIIPLLKEKLEESVQNAKRKVEGANSLTVKFGGFQIQMASWRDVYIGIAETCLQLNKGSNIRLVAESERNLESYSYRQLSNGQYICPNWSAKESQIQITRLLRELQIPDEFMEVIYKGNHDWLPIKKIVY